MYINIEIFVACIYKKKANNRLTIEYTCWKMLKPKENVGEIQQ